jgi:hypothetical protein
LPIPSVNSEMDSLDATQSSKLAAMRQEFSDKGSPADVNFPLNDSCFLRYLRARKFDLDKAKNLLQETLNWRRDFGVEEIFSSSWINTVAKENETGKTYVRGVDADGHALVYMRPKNENTYEHDGNLKHLVYNLERACSVMRNREIDEHNASAEKMCLLIDYDGYSLLNAPPIKTARATLNILQNHYPERLFRAYCIRPPWIFSTFWTMISPFIDPVTKAKIVMLHGSPEDIAARLSADGISLDILESSLGGKDGIPFNSSVYIGVQQPHSFVKSMIKDITETSVFNLEGVGSIKGTSSKEENDGKSTDDLSLCQEAFRRDYSAIIKEALDLERL